MSNMHINHVIDKSDAPVCAYLYDLDHLQARIQWIRQCLPQGIQFLYAIKANSDRPILQTLSPFIDGYEVASLGEIKKARKACAQLPVAFGGPGKSTIELEGALENNVNLYHVESKNQLQRLNALAIKKNKRANVLLRVNPHLTLPNSTLKMAGTSTQFGIDQSQIDEILKDIASYKAIRLQGFHFHAISNNLSADNHINLIAQYINLTKHWQKQYRLRLQTLNIGGGIGINYQPNEVAFDWVHYCQQLDKLVKESMISFNLAMECGRFVTASCGKYLTEVTDIKKNNGEYFAILRGGTHHFRLPASWQHNHPFDVIPVPHWAWDFDRPTINNTCVTLCGELCTPKDVLARSANIKQLRVGDVIQFNLAGAYGWHISHHDFLSHPHPEKHFKKQEKVLQKQQAILYPSELEMQ